MWEVDSQAPVVITAQPQSQTVPLQGTVALTVVASGTQPLAYQWFFNSTNLIGVAGPTLTLTGFGPANEGNYSVNVSNSLGSSLSDPANLYLETPLRFINPSVASNVGFQARLLGAVGGHFVVQWSTNLYDWTPLMTNSASTGISDVTDTNGFQNTSDRFYRAVLAP